MSECYVVMFDGVNLYSYQMTKNEKASVENLRHDCIVICDRLSIPRAKLADGRPYMGRLLDNHDFCIKYKEKIGYYVLDGERGVFHLRKSFPERNKEKAKYRILTYEIHQGGFQYELMNRCKLQEMWKRTYKVEYDSRKAAFEYAIRKHVDALSCFTDEVIVEYTNYMNRWFEESHWHFNRENMIFEEYCSL